MAIGSLTSAHELRARRPVAERSLEARAAFLKRTYLHLLGALLAITTLEWGLFRTGLARPIAWSLLSTSWLVVIAGLGLVSWIAARAARAVEAPAAQYAALAGYVLTVSLLLVPLLLLAEFAVPGVIPSAALLTLLSFTGLTVDAYAARQVLPFQDNLLRLVGPLVLTLVGTGLLFGLQLGPVLAVVLVALAGGTILRDTSSVLRRYREDRYAAAALDLLASAVVMFWHVPRLFGPREEPRELSRGA